MNTVYTYHSHVEGIASADELKLILLWQRQWRAMGWEPIVLNEYTAQKHPLFEKFYAKCMELPTVNKRQYEVACFMRWLAMVQVGGGFMADYDCFLHDPSWAPNVSTSKGRLICYQWHVPALVHGTAKNYLQVVNAILNYKVTEEDRVQNGQLHVSDMYVLSNMKGKYEQRMDIKSYGENDWDTWPIVHYSSGTMIGKQPRWKFIPELRKP